MDIIRFIKDWTLPVAMGTGAVFYLIFAFTPQLDEAAIVMGPFFATILPLFMFLILFVTFCKVDFHQLRPVAWHAWVLLFQTLFIGVLMALMLYPSLQSQTAEPRSSFLLPRKYSWRLCSCVSSRLALRQRRW